LNLSLPDLTCIADGRKRGAACPLAVVFLEEDIQHVLPHFYTAYTCFKTVVYYAAAL